MHFIHSPLAWAFLLVAAPFLIHLINLMRHRRVQWAAMDFLLQSYRKHRTWVWLKQLFLLLVRMAIVAIAVAMLAQLVTPTRWAELFGGNVRHHYVLLDDSYSMSDLSRGVRVYDRGVQVVRHISELTAVDGTNQKLTLLRFSQAARLPSDKANLPEDADANRPVESIPQPTQIDLAAGEHTDAWFQDITRRFDVTQLATGPGQALEVVLQLVKEAADETCVVHIISDFRQREWGHPTELVAILRQLEQIGAEIHLVRCANTQRANLGITNLTPVDGTLAAGVPFFAEVTVKNFGPGVATNIPLQIESIYYDQATHSQVDPARLEGSIDQLVVEPIDKIEPHKTVTRRVQVWFPAEGRHVVHATLPDDAVAADNHRYMVVNFPVSVPVLLIDGDSRQRNAYFLTSVFVPGGRVRTGIRPEVKDIAFLRDISADQLNRFDSIYLLDIDRLDNRAVKNLESYLESGGGVCWFMGPQSNVEFCNELYRDGQGPFPLPLEGADVLGSDNDEEAPDFEVFGHPAFRIFHGRRNAFLSSVAVYQYYRAATGWTPDPQSSAQVAARLRNGLPLVVDRRHGKGHLVAFLTSMAPDWNNWAQNPSFVVMMLDLQSYLAARRDLSAPRLVGSPIKIKLDADKFHRVVTFVVPDLRTGQRKSIVRNADVMNQGENIFAQLGHTGLDHQVAGDTDSSGVYESWTTTREAAVQVERHAVNVDVGEGDLQLTESRRLAKLLKPLQFQLHQWDQFELQSADRAGFHWSEWLLYLAIVLLLFEQALAYWSSHHVPTRGGAK